MSFLKKIPGFRSGSKWKMAVAIIGYLAIFGAVGDVIGGGNDIAPTTATTTAAPNKTPEQIAQEKADAELKAKQEAEAKVAAEKAAAEAKAAKAAQALVTLKAEAKTIPYKDIARTPDTYADAKVKYTGNVIQVQESGNKIALRVNVTKTSYGYTDTVYVLYTKKDGEGRILEDDIINLWGLSGKLYTYKTVTGAEMTIPKINAKIVEVVK